VRRGVGLGNTGPLAGRIKLTVYFAAAPPRRTIPDTSLLEEVQAAAATLAGLRRRWGALVPAGPDRRRCSKHRWSSPQHPCPDPPRGGSSKPRGSAPGPSGNQFAVDSALEENGFELPVPREISSGFEASALRPS
jgi:hypothetical protein